MAVWVLAVLVVVALALAAPSFAGDSGQVTAVAHQGAVYQIGTAPRQVHAPATAAHTWAECDADCLAALPVSNKAADLFDCPDRYSETVGLPAWSWQVPPLPRPPHATV